MFLNKSFNEIFFFLNFRLQTWNFTTNHGKLAMLGIITAVLAEIGWNSTVLPSKDARPLCAWMSNQKHIQFGDKNKPGKKKKCNLYRWPYEKWKKELSQLVHFCDHTQKIICGFLVLKYFKFSKLPRFEIDTIALTK